MPARARPDLRKPDEAGRRASEVQVRHPQRRPRLRQVRRRSCRSPSRATNGTGMHVNMSIWKDGKPLFAGDKYADLSQEALWYIGGILKARQDPQKLPSPTPRRTPYKRLIPGFEAPLGWAACRYSAPQPLGLRPHSRGPRARGPSASRPASPTPPRTPISVSRPS